MNRKFLYLFVLGVFVGFGCSDAKGSDASDDTATDTSGTRVDTARDSDTTPVDYSDCSGCHDTPPATFPHEDARHNGLACNNPDCHGDMINATGTQLADDSLHDNGMLDVTCGAASCHGNTASCESCHATPPAESPHVEIGHASLACDNPNCHGGIVNADGSAILQPELHNNGSIEATCDGCHSNK